MKSRVWSDSVLLVSVVLALVATSCQAAATGSSGDAGEPYKIGALLSITGGASTLGVPQRNTLEMLHEELQATGGIRGPDGLMHPVELIIYDTESDETKAVLAAKKLIEEDEVSIILGSSTSGESLAVLDTIEKSQVPLISMALSIDIVEPAAEHRWSFKTTQNDRMTSRVIAEYFLGQGITKVAWLSMNNAFGDSGLKEFKPVATELGIDIVTIEKHEVGDTDTTAQLTKIDSSDAEALVNWSILPGGAIVAKNAHDLGLDMPIFNTGAASNPKFIGLAGPEAAEGVFLATSKQLVYDQLPEDDPQKEQIATYATRYRETFGEEIVSFGGYVYDAFRQAVRAMENAGPDKAAIRDELEKGEEFVGVSGIYTYTRADHNGIDRRSYALLQVTGGEYELVQVYDDAE